MLVLGDLRRTAARELASAQARRQVWSAAQAVERTTPCPHRASSSYLILFAIHQPSRFKATFTPSPSMKRTRSLLRGWIRGRRQG